MRSRAGLATALLVVLACCVPEHGQAAVREPAGMLPPVGDYPDAECNKAAAGDFFLGRDGAFWECICEVRTFIDDDDCAWYNQGPLSSGELRLLKRKLRRSSIPRGRVINTKLWRVMPL